MTLIRAKDYWWAFALLVVSSYLIGNINFAILISKAKHNDITHVGSGNPGTMNMSRAFGLKIGLLTLILDILKGAFPTLIGALVFQKCAFISSGINVNSVSGIMCGFSAVTGHIFPFWRKFKGGKGIASTIGVFLVLEPCFAPIFMIAALMFILYTEMGSMGSFIATTPPAIIYIWHHYLRCFRSGIAYSDGLSVYLTGMLLAVGIIFLTWFAHRANIKRLIYGEEHPTDWMRMIKELKYKKKKSK